MSDAGARSRNPERSVRGIFGTELYSALMERADLGEYATDAIKFWEPRRLLYNLTLAAIVVIYFAIGYPLSKTVLTIDFCLGLFLLAVIANVAYCAAYIVDIFAQGSGFRDMWRRVSQGAIRHRHTVCRHYHAIRSQGNVPRQRVILKRQKEKATNISVDSL